MLVWCSKVCGWFNTTAIVGELGNWGSVLCITISWYINQDSRIYNFASPIDTIIFPSYLVGELNLPIFKIITKMLSLKGKSSSPTSAFPEHHWLMSCVSTCIEICARPIVSVWQNSSCIWPMIRRRAAGKRSKSFVTLEQLQTAPPWVAPRAETVVKSTAISSLPGHNGFKLQKKKERTTQKWLFRKTWIERAHRWATRCETTTRG